MLFFQRLAATVRDLYDSFEMQNKSLSSMSLSDLNETYYYDSDIPEKLPADRKFTPCVYTIIL